MKKTPINVSATAFLMLLISSISNAQTLIKLYDSKPKGSENWTWSEQTSSKNTFNTEVVYNVVEPSITAYLPPKDLATGTAIIVAHEYQFL